MSTTKGSKNPPNNWGLDGRFLRARALSEVLVNPENFQALMKAIEKALGQFPEAPSEPGFDLEVYEELRRVREALIRAQRDLRDTNIRRDSRNPLGT